MSKPLQGSSNKSRHRRGLHIARGSTRKAKSSEQDLGNLIAMPVPVSIEFHGYQLNSTAINKTGIKAYPTDSVNEEYYKMGGFL